MEVGIGSPLRVRMEMDDLGLRQIRWLILKRRVGKVVV